MSIVKCQGWKLREYWFKNLLIVVRMNTFEETTRCYTQIPPKWSNHLTVTYKVTQE